MSYVKSTLVFLIFLKIGASYIAIKYKNQTNNSSKVQTVIDISNPCIGRFNFILDFG